MGLAFKLGGQGKSDVAINWHWLLGWYLSWTGKEYYVVMEVA